MICRTVSSQKKENDTANRTFKRKRRDAFDLAEDKPQAKDKQAQRQDINAPAKNLGNKNNCTANKCRTIGGDKTQNNNNANECKDDADHIKFAFGGKLLPPGKCRAVEVAAGVISLLTQVCPAAIHPFSEGWFCQQALYFSWEGWMVLEGA